MSEHEPDFLDGLAIGSGEQESPEDVSPEPAEPAPAAETVEAKQPEATTAPDPKEEHSVPYAAMRAEREKRQRLERELEQLRQQQPAPELPSFYEAPDLHLQQIEQRATQRLFVALEAQAREMYPDYDEVFAEVEAHARDNPMAVQQVLAAPNPALAAYRLGQKLRELKQMEDPAAYRARIEAEVRAKVEAEFRAREEQRSKTLAAIPPDLTDTRNAKGQFAPSSESVLSELFPRK